MLLTDAQIWEIRELVQLHHAAVVVNTISPAAVAPEILDKLKARGMVDLQVTSIEDAYLYGQLLAQLDNPAVQGMTLEQFKKFIKTNPIPLSDIEQRAVAMAQQFAAQYVVGLGNKVNQQTGAMMIEADDDLRRQLQETIRDKTAENIARRESTKKLKSDLGWATKDWARDWDRIAITEKHSAMQAGVRDSIRAEHGADALVAKVPMPDACFTAGTLIETRRGQVPIEDVRVGDEVLTHKLRWRKVTYLMQREYEGELYGFNGCAPGMTANHPMLVDLDWRRADAVKCGSYMVEVVRGEAQDNPTCGAQGAFLGDVSGANTSPGVPVATVQFYRYLQMRDSNVDVVFVDGQLRNGFEICQQMADTQAIFCSTGESTLPGLGFGALCVWGKGLLSSFSRQASKFLSLRFGHAAQSGLLAFGLGREGQAVLYEAFADSRTADIKGFTESSQRVLAGLQHLGQFVFGHVFPGIHGFTPKVRRCDSIVRVPYSGVVYNFEVAEDNSYIADGFVVHNCQRCKSLFLDKAGLPKVWRLSALEANGHNNVGRKSPDWLPVIGPVHPHCQCQLVRIPAGWGFDEDGSLVPGGKIGRVRSEGELERALRLEDELHKAKLPQVTFQGIPIRVENKPGTVRQGEDAEGEGWRTRMLYAYGYIERTNGADGEEIDVFMGPDPQAGMVYVIHQDDPDSGTYDEDKVMLGFPTEGDARAAYAMHYDRPMEYTLSRMSVDHFKRWIAGGALPPRLVLSLAKSGGPYIGPRGGKWKDPQHTIPWKPVAVPKKAKVEEEFTTPTGGTDLENIPRRLYRAGDDDILTGPTSFAREKDSAIEYLDNPGFGGSTLYVVEAPEIDPKTVFDLVEESDQDDALREVTGIDMGSITADQVIAHQHVVNKLVDLGYQWVRLIDTYPEGSETWTWLGEGEDPELEELGEDIEKSGVRVTANEGAAGSPAGGRSPSVLGTSPNFYFRAPKRPRADTRSGMRDLLDGSTRDREMSDTWKRGPEDYEYRYPVEVKPRRVEVTPLEAEPDQAAIESARAQVDAHARKRGKAAELANVAPEDEDEELEKAGPYIGPRGGRWADPQHTIPWDAGKTHMVYRDRTSQSRQAPGVIMEPKVAELLKLEGGDKVVIPSQPGTHTMQVSDLAGIPVDTLDEENKRRIMAAHAEGKKLPPIEVSVTAQGKIHLIDGHHRLAIARALGRKTIDVTWHFQKSAPDDEKPLQKSGPYIGSRGGRWADPDHKTLWREVAGLEKAPLEERVQNLVQYAGQLVAKGIPERDALEHLTSDARRWKLTAQDITGGTRGKAGALLKKVAQAI